MIRYAVTQRSSFPGDEAQRVEHLLLHAKRWAAEGVDFVQLREKNLDAGALTELARRLIVALGTRTKLLINGRADVAMASGAAGVHLTAHPDELTPGQVRRIFAPAIVSVSCHTVAEAKRTRESGADLVLFGPVFEKRVGVEIALEGQGLEMLRSVCEAAAPVRVLALGGVTEQNAALCIAAGAAGVAGIRLFASS